MQKTKKSLIASGLAIVVCLAMLIGTTFAWFTDSVTNKGNHIQAGTLDIGATVASVTEGTTYEINGKTFDFGAAQDIETLDGAIINETNWEPGQSNAKLLTVTNKGSLAAKVKLDFTVTDGGLMNALWFDFVQVTDEGQSGQFTKRPMNTLEQFAEAPEFSLASGESISFILMYGMYEEAGNVYQGKEFTADVSIIAKQDTVETDGFGSDQYDKDAVYPELINDTNGFISAIAGVPNNGTIRFSEDISFPTTTAGDARNINKTLNIDFSGNTAFSTNENDNAVFRVVGNSRVNYSNGTITASDNTYCTVLTGNDGAVATLENMTLNNSRAYGISLKALSGSTIIVRNSSVNSTMGGGAVAAGGTINIYNSTFTQAGSYDWNSTNVAASNGGVANIYSGTFGSDNYGLYIFSSGGTINVYSGTFRANTMLKADLDLNNYPTAEGTINIYGGSFDGKIDISSNCTLNIEAGTFANTGLTKEAFAAYVASGSTLTESNGVFTVTKN